LDLDEQVVSHEIDDVAVDRDLGPIAHLGIPALQRGVERSFPKQPDPGCDGWHATPRCR
jgi:hypothetical protein